jgi:NAD(P)-dependent dehydrogenase (short-subunit alcohol dehydrogenase family)
LGELSGSVVVVTAAGRGIGRALTNGFLREGAAVVALDPDLTGAEPFDEPDPHGVLAPALYLAGRRGATGRTATAVGAVTWNVAFRPRRQRRVQPEPRIHPPLRKVHSWQRSRR